MFRGRGRGGMRGGLRGPPTGGAAPRTGFSNRPPPPPAAGPPRPSVSQFGQHSSGLPLLPTKPETMLPAPPVPLPVTPTTDATNGGMPSPLPLKPLKPFESSSMLSTNYGAMAEIKRPPSDDEPSFKRARIGPDHERRDRESDRSSLDGDPLTDSPTAVSTGVVKLEFIPPAPTEEGGTEDLFYMGREPATPAQLRVLLRECIVDLLVTRGKTTADGTRYIAHGDLIFNFFDEINLRGGVKLRDLVPKDEVSQKNLSSLPGITIQQIDGACVCYRLTAFDATNRLRCMLKRWEATAGQVALARSAVDYIKQVTGTDAFPLGAFALGIANRDDDLLRVAMANDDVLSSKLQLICAAEANGWSITRISKRDCCPAYSVPRLTIVQEDQVPCYMTVEIPHLDFHVEIRFVTECGAMAEMQRLKHEIMDAEPELLLLAKVLRRLVRQPCRSNEVDATHISMLLVRSFYISTAYRGMGLYQDYVDLLYFFGEEEEIGDSLSEWSCSDDSLADTIGLPRLENLIHGIQLSLSAADLWWPLYLCS